MADKPWGVHAFEAYGFDRRVSIRRLKTIVLLSIINSVFDPSEAEAVYQRGVNR